MIEPAVEGTKNVITAAVEAGVHRVVFTSSIGTVYMDPNRNPDAVVDESCWSDLDYCKITRNWYYKIDPDYCIKIHKIITTRMLRFV